MAIYSGRFAFRGIALKKRDTVAITAGSRGIPASVDLLSGIVEAVKHFGGDPFIIPAMGSLDGATVEGQVEILKRLGITEETVRARVPDIPRRVSGYNMPALLSEHGFHVARALVGSECTCVLVLEAATKLVDWPPVRSLLVIGYEDIFVAADHVTEPLHYNPIAVEALDDSFIDDMKKKGMHPRT